MSDAQLQQLERRIDELESPQAPPSRSRNEPNVVAVG
jgi:hypothetical protein